MLDLTNDSTKQGVIDAIRAILSSRAEPARVVDDEEDEDGYEFTDREKPKQTDKLRSPQHSTDVGNSDGDAGQAKTKAGGTGGTESDEEEPEDEEENEESEESGGGSGDESEEDSDGEPSETSDKEADEAEDEDSEKDSEKAKKDGMNGDYDAEGQLMGPRGEIKRMDDDASGLYDDEKNAETLAGIKADKEEREYAKQREKDRADALARMAANANRLKTADDLVDDLYYAISTQVTEISGYEDTYEHGEDPVYADSGYIMPQQEGTETKLKPLIYAFIDQSGSFSQYDIQRARSILAVLDDFVQDGKILPPKLFAFGNYVQPIKDDGSYGYIGSGTSGFPDCMQIIEKSLDGPRDEVCTNVLIISDRDIGTRAYRGGQTYTDELPVLRLEGCVFWCWKNGSVGQGLSKFLIGEAGNFSYSF